MMEFLFMDSGFTIRTEERAELQKWLSQWGHFDLPTVGIKSWQQGWGRLHFARSILNAPLCLAGREYAWGLGAHADSEIVLHANIPLRSFRAQVGIDDNRDSRNGVAECVFSIWRDDQCLAESGRLNVHSQPEAITVELNGITEFTLKIKTSNTIHLAHADWVECEAVTCDGQVLKIGTTDTAGCPCSLPLSFQYHGQSSEVWFRKWGIKKSQTPGDGFITHHFITRDTDTGLECRIELQEYAGLPAVLWNVSFTNTGTKPTPILDAICPLDLCWPALDRKILHRAHGAFHYEDVPFGPEAFRDDFMMGVEDLTRHSEVLMAGTGGRPSVDWMPYFNFEGTHGGLMFGIGWTGQWQARIKASTDTVHFQAGMEFIHTILNPGETIRQPEILIVFWQGDDPIRGHNLLRRFIQENVLPRDHQGHSLRAPACNLTWGGMVAASHLERIRNLAKEKIPLDYYWIDAGWYGKAGPNASEFTPEWGSQAGDWNINRETFPHGVKEVSDAAHAVGKKFLLWVEPERAICGTPITQEHPEWFLEVEPRVPKTNLLLNFGNPAAREWCTELIAGLIEHEGLDCYRQDFNISPLPYWQHADAPDRVGMHEIRYVEGLYRFLGELRRRFPDLLIDNCASGGRRLDFEMMRYSIPLWGSDMQCSPDYLAERNLQQVQGLSYWLPQFAFGTQNHPGDTYHFRSTMAAGIATHLFTYEACPIKADYPYQWLRERLAEYHRAKVCFSGDFYPLCDQTASFKYWTANQFDRPDLNAGVVEVFRKSASNIEKMTFSLQGLDDAAIYEIENADDGSVTQWCGRQLREDGLPVEISRKRDSRLFFYRKQQ